MQQNMKILVLLGAILVGGFTSSNSFAFFNFFEGPKNVEAVEGQIQIPLKDVNDGKAHHYAFKADGKEIPFFVVKSPDGVVRAAFDACDVCFPEKKGYSQKGENMICNNCGRKFHVSRVNVEEGGCNPAPLKRKVVGNSLVIMEQDVLPGKRYF